MKLHLGPTSHAPVSQLQWEKNEFRPYLAGLQTAVQTKAAGGDLHAGY